MAKSALAKAESALAKANLEIDSLNTKPGRSPAGAQLLHGHTYWRIIGGAKAIYLLEEDDVELNPVCWSPLATPEYIFISAAHSFAPSKGVEAYVDLQEGMTEKFRCDLLHSSTGPNKRVSHCQSIIYEFRYARHSLLSTMYIYAIIRLHGSWHNNWASNINHLSISKVEWL
jgi:hypothetical protein